MKWTRSSLLFGAFCFCFVSGLLVKSVKAPAPYPGSNTPASFMATPAGCGNSSVPIPAPLGRAQDEQQSNRPSLVFISAHSDRTSDSEEAANSPGIVGMWHFTFTAEGNNPPGPPDGAVVDSGYVTWHSDGTELMNSGRAPTTGSFCMGVWKQAGRSTFKLNHFALAWSWDPNTPVTGPGTGGADFAGPANIRETVTLDKTGNQYQGWFTLTQYQTDGTTIAEAVTGKVTATRITVD
jgi:hypothetical protein